MRSSALLLLALAMCPAATLGARLRQSALVAANPVRKVVTLLQNMAEKVEAEGVAEDELYKKFSCYCKTGAADLQSSISSAGARSPSLGADIKASEEQLLQAKQGLKDAQTERAEAKAAVAAAHAMREKDAAAHAADKTELESNIAAIKAAVSALESGMAGFLQTGKAAKLRKIVMASSFDDDSKEGVLSFLSGKQDATYAPSSGEVTGILKQIGDEMSKSLSQATAAEDTSIAEFEALIAAKTKEINTLTASVETTMSKIGELGVSVVQLKQDLSDTEARLLEDKALLAELEKGCGSKDKEYAERVKTRGEELAAITETIKILNDDDALELFKKTLPGASGASLVQVATSAADMRARALRALSAAGRGHPGATARLNFIALALKGKKVGFEKVIGLIDTMVALLKKEQGDDENKKEYCSSQFDSTEDKKKGLELKASDLKTAIASAEEGIAAAAEEIAALQKQVKSLDSMVAEATAQRKEEHEEYKLLVQSDSQAKELLGFAKNRLNKFYNPKLYNPPAKTELSSMGAISRDMGGAVLVQISEHAQHKSLIEPPPATWDAYAKKSEESTGVVEMIDLLIKDLDKELTEADTEEKDAQADYDATIAAAKEERVSMSKSLKDKIATKADLQADLESGQADLASAQSELMATDKLIADLHAECDWLLQYFEVRKEARADEVSALTKAKAVLSGADYSLLQTKASGLRGKA